MSEKPISPLLQRMIEDMTVRNFVEKTRNDYVHHVKAFTAFLSTAGADIGNGLCQDP
jgi:integrase/recombinase XerD